MRVLLRAAEFFGTLVRDTGDLISTVMGKRLQTLRPSCQALPVLGPLRSWERQFISLQAVLCVAEGQKLWVVDSE